MRKTLPPEELRQILFDLSIGRSIRQRSRELASVARFDLGLLDTFSCCWLAVADAIASQRVTLACHELGEEFRRREIEFRARCQLLKRWVAVLDASGLPYTLLKGAHDQVEHGYALRRPLNDIDMIIDSRHIEGYARALATLGQQAPLGRSRAYNIVWGDMSEDSATLRVEMSLDYYGTFPFYRVYPIHRLGDDVTPAVRLRLVCEEFLQNACVRPGDINDIQRVLSEKYDGDVVRMLSDLSSPIFRALVRHVLKTYSHCQVPEVNAGLSTLVARRFLHQKGRRPLVFGAHWLRAMEMRRRHASPLESAMAVSEFLGRTYLHKFGHSGAQRDSL